MRMYVTMFALSLAAAAAMYAADAKSGKEFYDGACKSCHGPNGTPNPSVAKMLKVEMKDLAKTDADIASVITMGKGKMKPIKSVTGKAVDDVAAYVHTFKK